MLRCARCGWNDPTPGLQITLTGICIPCQQVENIEVWEAGRRDEPGATTRAVDAIVELEQKHGRLLPNDLVSFVRPNAPRPPYLGGDPYSMGLPARPDYQNDQDLVERALEVSGLSLREFAREVLHGLRTEGAIRLWLRGARVPAGAREIMERYLAEPAAEEQGA